MGQLLIENMPFTLRMEESKDGSNRVVVRGQFARSDKATENKRLYREHLWKREIGRLNEAMTARRAFGELDHPADGRTKLQRVSHLMTGLRVEGTEVVGECEVLDTPNGRILKSLFSAGAQVGVSSRGYGSTKTLADGTEEVQEDFRLDTFDFVADPATRTAYPKVFQEELEHVAQAEKDLTVESLKRDYPGLLRVIAEEQLGDVGKLVSESEDRAGKRLRGTFQRELRGLVENLSEDAYRKARSELESDPEVAGAKVVLEQIVSLLTPYGMEERIKQEVAAKDQEIADLRRQLADRELEVQKSTREATEYGSLAKEAGYRLHIERKLSDHPSKDTIVKLIGNVTDYKSVTEIDERIDALIKEFVHVKPRKTETDEKIADLKGQIEGKDREVEAAKAEVKAAEAKLREAHERRDEALGKAQKAVEIAEGFQLQLYLEKKISGRPDADKLRRLAEDAGSQADVDRILKEAVFVPQSELGEGEVARIRARVGRGKQSDLLEEVQGGKNGRGTQGEGGILGQFGLIDEEFDRLSGTRAKS